MSIKILDCTLRDGGYINNWEFCLKTTKEIVESLEKAKIDFIELGFLTKDAKENNTTLFKSFDDITRILPKNIKDDALIAMIAYGKFDLDKIPNANNSYVKTLRIIFKKNETKEALEYCKKVMDKGYKIFINPTFIDTFSDYEILDILKEVNEIRPSGFSIVDSMGSLKEQDVLRLFYLIDNNLNKNIALCFHSHNNLQLSFPNAQALIKVCKDRELIIDSSVFGMGRGAGNLCTELITQYINDNHDGKYDIVPILKIIDECINPIFMRTPWGYSVPYYLAATNHCHPNYAKYLAEKQTIPVEMINILLNAVPSDKRSFYDVELIKKIYLENFSNEIDDGIDVGKFKEMIAGKNLLILAPGKSLENEKDRILEFIEENNPFIISLNFEPKDYKADLVFVTNLKRFLSLGDTKSAVMSTSNIEHSSDLKINYSSYLNHSKMYDNVGLMLFKLLMSVGIKSINIAGLDGFSTVANENYFSAELVNNSKLGDIDERNDIMRNEIKKISKDMKVEFITESRYNA